MSELSDQFKPLTPGDRVVAVSHTGEDDFVNIFGFGVYQCDDVIGKEAVGAVSALARLHGQPVPKIQLDDGNIVWGPECHIFREWELNELLKADGVKGMSTCDLSEVRAKAPNFLIVKFFVPPDREIQWIPLSVSNDTFRKMESLESLGRDYHLEGELLRLARQVTITFSDNEEDYEIEVVASMSEPYTEALERIVDRAYKRFMATA